MSHTTTFKVNRVISPRKVWAIFALLLAVKGFTPVVRMAYTHKAV